MDRFAQGGEALLGNHKIANAARLQSAEFIGDGLE
jgi:hypothetical protein